MCRASELKTIPTESGANNLAEALAHISRDNGSTRRLFSGFVVGVSDIPSSPYEAESSVLLGPAAWNSWFKLGLKSATVVHEASVFREDLITEVSLDYRRGTRSIDGSRIGPWNRPSNYYNQIHNRVQLGWGFEQLSRVFPVSTARGSRELLAGEFSTFEVKLLKWAKRKARKLPKVIRRSLKRIAGRLANG